MNFFYSFPNQWKLSKETNTIHAITMNSISFYNSKLSFIVVTVFRITVDNTHTTYKIGIFRIFSVFLIDCGNLIDIRTLLITTHIMELVTFCSKVFQIRFFLRQHIIKNVIDHVVICFFQFFHLCQWLILALAFLNFCHYNFIHFFYFFHKEIIISTNAFSRPAFLFQKFLCCFFDGNFIIFIHTAIYQAELFIVKGVVISFFCGLNCKIPFAHLICQFTKRLFFQIQEMIQLFKTDAVYKMCGYIFSVI